MDSFRSMHVSTMELYHDIATTCSAITSKGYAVNFIQRTADHLPLIRVNHKDKVVTITMEGPTMDQETLIRLKRALAYGCRP